MGKIMEVKDQRGWTRLICPVIEVRVVRSDSWVQSGKYREI